jgi:hypothetical protein
VQFTAGLLAVLGVCAAVAGAVFNWYGLPAIIDSRLHAVGDCTHAHTHNTLQTLPLTVDADGQYSSRTEKWVRPPIEGLLQIWLFDVTNGDDVRIRGVRPAVVERGPYAYRLVSAE